LVNTYALSAEDDVMDFGKSTFYNTPVTNYADLTAIARDLQPSHVTCKVADLHTPGYWSEFAVQCACASSDATMAFMVHIELIHAATRMRLLPAMYTDNYISMLPGELVSVRARVPTSLLNGTLPDVLVDTFNDALV